MLLCERICNTRFNLFNITMEVKMDARKLILSNCFTYCELLKMKSSYAKAVREVYGKGGKAASDETFENYILVLADILSNSFFSVVIIGIVSTGIMMYVHGLTRGPLAMLIICMIAIVFVIFKNSRDGEVNLVTTLKLLNLRFKMFIFWISPPPY